MIRLYASAVLLMLLLAGCAPSTPNVASADVVQAMSAPANSNFARAYEPIDFVFPAVQGAHPEYSTEWWYYTGNIDGDDGRQFGYQLTFFRSALSAEEGVQRVSNLATNQVYMAHFALTDVRANRHSSFERFSRGGDLANAVGDPLYQVWLDDWSIVEVERGVQRMRASAMGDQGEVALDLTLRETREPILHGDRGLSQKGPEPGNASYYYSLVNMETTGTVTSDGRTFDVSGLSWMDHEFGTSALSSDAVGWDWFSLQMDNGMVLMFAQIRRANGEALGTFEGTLVLPNGEQRSLDSSNFVLTPQSEWTSPRTGFTYPASWTLDVPSVNLTLAIEPLISDQEMQVTFVYFEGAIQAEGTLAGEPVVGRGYVELTGYGNTSAYQR